MTITADAGHGQPTGAVVSAKSKGPHPTSAWLMVGGAIFFRSLAAVAAKAAANSGATLESSILNPWYGGLLALLFLQALCWTAALRRIPLTVAYPFMSLVFALNLAAARWIFAERVAPAHVWGVVLVIAGVSLVGREGGPA